MIVYFANKNLSILGQASTSLPEGLVITSDKKIDEVESGVSSFEFEVGYDDETRTKVEKWAAVGNYVLRNENDDCGLFTIIETELDTLNKTVYVYAEDVGLDLLNEIVGETSTTTAYNMTWYVQQLINGTGFEIGSNKSPSTTKKLSFDNKQTKAARLADIAAEFDCEISFSFKVRNLQIERRYINIHKERGRDEGKTLYLNKHIDKITINQSIANLATEMRCTGGTPENSDDPITLKGYSYDDGDIYVAGEYIKSRKAYQKWSRYLWRTSDSQAKSGHITKLFDSQAETQAQLFKEAYAELKKYLDVEVNYEIDIKIMPEDVKIGDRVNIVDEKGELFLSSRILKLERSVCNDSYEATLGEHIIKPSGIHQKVLALANQFSKTAVSAARALKIAKNAKTLADEAQKQADSAQASADEANVAADEAKTAADTAAQSASEAQTAADNATSAVEGVQTEIKEMNEIIDDANEAANFAKEAAEIAQAKAEESLLASEAAKTDAAAAQTAASEAKTASTAAVETANTAKTTAETAKSQATEASTVANAAKLDAESAEAEVNNLGERLDSVTQTMKADYARKTELTETEASLQSQITQNAAQISLNVQSITTIDETANNAAELAAQAQETASQAQTEAGEAAADALEAQTAADTAAQAAADAQAEADKAKTAAATAQEVADKADADLKAAEENLATISGRVDATEEDIAAAEQLVATAQAAADKANADAATATSKANTAQQKADEAATAAANAQATADDAVSKATTAQAAADAAKGDAAAAQKTANEAKTAALNAQTKADNAATDALNAQTKADNAAQTAASATQAAADAQAQADQAAADLETAQAELAEIESKADATAEEVEAAKANVAIAQAAADEAKTNAANAQAAADAAQADADAAQADADAAKEAAKDAQDAADAAQDAADKAQADVDALEIRVIAAETSITQTNQKIELLATKDEVATSLGGYYTKDETEGLISTSADNITLAVNQKFEKMQIGGRNLLLNSSFTKDSTKWSATQTLEFVELDGEKCAHFAGALATVKNVSQSVLDKLNLVNLNQEYVFSADVRLDNYVAGTTNPYVQLYFSGQYDNNGTSTWMGATTVSGSPNITTQTTSGEWTRMKWVVKFTKIPTSMILHIYTRDYTGDLYFKNLKFEYGNQPTDWTPAPEDVDGKFEDYYTKSETKSSVEIDEAISLSVSTTKEELTKKIDDIEIGSRNYAAVSKVNNYSMSDYSYNNYTWSGTHDGTYEGLQIAYTALSEAGQYVVSYTVTVTAGTLLGLGGGLGSNTVSKWYVNGELMKSNYNVSRTTAWSVPEADKYEVVIYLNATGNDNLYIQPNRGGATSVTFSVTDIMVEKGNKKSDWSPAPEDVEAKFAHYYTKTEVDTAIDASEEGINLSVDTKITNVKIGGKNLLKDSRLILLHSNNSSAYPIAYTEENEDGRSFYRYTRTETTLSPTTMSLYSSIPLSDVTENLYGMEVTFSFLARASHDTTANLMHYMRVDGANVNFGADKNFSLNSSWQRISLVATIGAEYEKKSTNLLRFNPYSIVIPDGVIDNFYLDVCEWKIEFGNKTTDWTAAPEDIDSEIDDATNKADNALEGLTEAKTQIALLTDSIGQLVRNGGTGTLIKQTSEGLYYFDISDLESAINSANTAITNLEGIVTDANGEIDLLKTAAEALQSKTEYVKSYTDENDQPCLELGEGDSVYKLFITNTGIMMKDGTDTPTQVTNKQLVITKATVREEIQIGDDENASISGVWLLKRRANGNIGIIWKDVNE